MSELETKLYDAMGQRFAVVKVFDEKNIITVDPDRFDKAVTVIARNLKYSEAQAIIKLLGDGDGGS